MAKVSFYDHDVSPLRRLLLAFTEFREAEKWLSETWSRLDGFGSEFTVTCFMNGEAAKCHVVAWNVDATRVVLSTTQVIEGGKTSDYQYEYVWVFGVKLERGEQETDPVLSQMNPYPPEIKAEQDKLVATLLTQ